MRIPFYKYQGTGNDFIVVDLFRHNWLAPLDDRHIRDLCDRKFGIGADGLIGLNPHAEADFEMIYFNADGHLGSLCGNGSRCAVAAMYHLDRLKESCTFIASDGLHHARVNGMGTNVEIQLGDLKSLDEGKGYYLLDTGSPHYVTFVEDLSDLDIVDTGKKIRFSPSFREEGINVNFVEVRPSSIAVNTYERGVENETLSCGTGVTAAAIAFARDRALEGSINLVVHTKGGDLKVKFDSAQGIYSNIWLSGPAVQVFHGTALVQ